MHTFSSVLFIIAAGVLAISGCSSGTTTKPSEPGSLVRVDSVGYYGKARVQAIKDSVLDRFMASATMKAPAFRDKFLDAANGVKLYKVTYSSVIPEKNNAAVTATGLLAIPDNVKPGAPIVSYQHGTIFEREGRPSNPDGSMEVQMMISQFASQGYIVISADYFGDNPGGNEPNSYCVPGSTAQACYDMYLASKQVLKNMNIVHGKLFINGWSQGGYSTYAFGKRLQDENVSVTAVSTASGPSDPQQFISQLIHKPSPFAGDWVVAVVADVLCSYDAYYGLNGYLEQAIKPEYLQAAKDLNAFKMTYEEFHAKVPHTFEGAFTQKFIDDTRDTASAIMKGLDSVGVYRWKMNAPLKAFYSNRDEGMIAVISKRFPDYQLTLGNTNVESVDAGPEADHRCVYIMSIIKTKPWFDSLK